MESDRLHSLSAADTQGDGGPLCSGCAADDQLLAELVAESGVWLDRVLAEITAASTPAEMDRLFAEIQAADARMLSEMEAS